MTQTIHGSPSLFNKSVMTNLAAAVFVAAGYVFAYPVITNVGLFALSGALTNWLAIYMLFESVPGLYGSGVIPARFEDFKLGIHSLIMEQFFTRENFERFYEGTATNSEGPHFDFGPIIDKADLGSSFDALVSTVKESSFGGMLGMFGGEQALEPLRVPFAHKMKASLKAIAHSPLFQETVHSALSQSSGNDEIHAQIGGIVQKRLDELTPQLVKEIIQKMIRDHLGWLVVWGGFFGGIIGLVASLIQP